ncbi:pRL2-8 [Streptomyces venezuelae]|uniref:pRL2-8 n=1 Tax=Streptomyces venezuelae TaxID=54571 RepID=UPI0034185CA6
MADANNPPKGECSQCWYHAYASKQAHEGLKWNQDCAACVDHKDNGCPDSMIVGGR